MKSTWLQTNTLQRRATTIPGVTATAVVLTLACQDSRARQRSGGAAGRTPAPVAAPPERRLGDGERGPGADVVLAWHIGFEGLDSFGGILKALNRGIPPILFTARRIPGRDVPRDNRFERGSMKNGYEWTPK